MQEKIQSEINSEHEPRIITPDNAGSVFVTGGSGLVGSHLIKELSREGRRVLALHRGEVAADLRHENIQWVKGDILDVIALEEAMQNVEQVYHCAAIVSFDPSKKMEMFKTNIEGTANVVNASINAGVKKLVYVSSVAALGRVKQGRKVRVDETMSWTKENSDSNYSKSKYLAELEVWRGIGEGLQAVMVNPVIILGAGDWTKGSAAMFKSAYDEFPWYTEGSGGYVDVLDVVKSMTQLMNSDISGQRFVISAEHKTYKEIFSLIARFFNKKPPRKEATSFMAAIVWRLEKMKAMINGNSPLLTKETAETALSSVYFDNAKLLKYLPDFEYIPLEQTIERVCREMEKRFLQSSI
jgi:dihydroflavonol-4-reductase